MSSFYFWGCSPAIRTSKEQLNDKIYQKTVRVCLDEVPHSISIKFKENVFLKNSDDKTTTVKQNSVIEFTLSNGFITADFGDKNFIGSNLEIYPAMRGNHLEYKGKKYKGLLRIVHNSSSLFLVNELSIEEYLKGVLPLEMGNIKGDSNFEALKAFSIIARNFSYMKLQQKPQLFDVYPDTRDQVYGGFSAEKELSNKAIDETSGLILTYHNQPAKVFYFSSCGGYTEDVGNVFSEKNIPYLVSVKDDNEPNCKIAPNFLWQEKYTGAKIVSLLFQSKLIDKTDYTVKNIEIKSRFKSGRVNELNIELSSDNGTGKEIQIYSNNIRKILKQSDGKSILRSTLFDIETKHINEDIEVIIKGKGNGHGVGLCQWGAIAKSREGSDYRSILFFYFPGTKIEKIND